MDVILQAMARVSLEVFVGAACLFSVAVTLRITRWWLLLRRFQPDLNFFVCIRPFLMNIVINDFMPVRIGDLVKMFAARETIRVPPLTRLGTIIIERFFDTLSIILILIVGALQLDVPTYGVILNTAYTMFFVLISALVLALYFSSIVERWILALLNLPLLRDRRIFRLAMNWTPQFLSTFVTLRKSGLTGLFAVSCVIWGLEGTMALIFARAIDPSVHVAGPYLSLACGVLSSILPSAPGSVGTFDYFLTLGVLESGMNKISAAAFALIVHSVFLAFSAMVAVILLSRKSTWKMLRECFRRNAGDPQA